MTEVSEQANYPASSTVANRVSFQYDALARVISTTDWLQADTKTDAFGRREEKGEEKGTQPIVFGTPIAVKFERVEVCRKRTFLASD